MLCVTRPIECSGWAIKRCEKDPAEKRNAQYKRPNEFRDDAVASMYHPQPSNQTETHKHPDRANCYRDPGMAKHELDDAIGAFHLTRTRLQRAIYFCLHTGSLPENTAGRRPRFGAKPVPKNFRKNYMSYKNPHVLVAIGAAMSEAA